MPGSQPQRHHWVPESYLRCFADEASAGTKAARVYLFDKAAGGWTDPPTSVKNVCTRRYLYAPSDRGGVRDWTLEAALSKVEGKLAPRWQEFIAGRPQLGNAELRGNLALFVATLHLRNPAVAGMVDRICDIRGQLYGPAELTSAAQQFRPPDRLGDEVPAEFQMDVSNPHRFFVQLIWRQAGHIARTFAIKHWAVLESEDEKFITSDRPVVFITNGGRRAGPGTRGAITVFPLNPQRAIVMGEPNRVRPDAYLPASAPVVSAINKQLWLNATRFIVASAPVAEAPSCPSAGAR